MRVVTLIFLLIFISSCSKTRSIGLSNKEVKSLKVTYSQEFRHKFWDTKWIFYEKNVCQFTSKFISKKTFTGTWSKKNDTITAYFFLKKIANERKLILDKKTNKLTEIIK